MRNPPFFVVGCVVLLSPLASLSGQISLGFEGGLSLAKMSVTGIDLDGVVDYQYREGFALGAFLEVPVTDLLSVQPELFYVQKGVEYPEVGYDVTFAWDYVEIPVLLRVNVPTKGMVVPYLLVGPALGFKARCRYIGEGGGIKRTHDCDEAGQNLNSADLGAVLGAGLSVGTGRGDIHFGARYNIGLTNIGLMNTAPGVKLTNRAFSFMAGYGFQLGG